MRPVGGLPAVRGWSGCNAGEDSGTPKVSSCAGHQETPAELGTYLAQCLRQSINISEGMNK